MLKIQIIVIVVIFKSHFISICLEFSNINEKILLYFSIDKKKNTEMLVVFLKIKVFRSLSTDYSHINPIKQTKIVHNFSEEAMEIKFMKKFMNCWLECNIFTLRFNQRE